MDKLSDEQNLYYQKSYSSQSVTGNTNNIASKYFHKALEKNVSRLLSHQSDKQILLEVGAGDGEHIQFVSPNTYEQYIMSDLREVKHDLASSKIKYVRANVENLPFNDDEFDRVICTCLLHHVEKPWIALREMRRVARKGRYPGLVSIALPHDPGILYRGLKKIARKRKLSLIDKIDFELIDALEHRNHYLSLSKMIRTEFKHDLINSKVYPLKLGSYHLEAFSIFQIQIR